MMEGCHDSKSILSHRLHLVGGLLLEYESEPALSYKPVHLGLSYKRHVSGLFAKFVGLGELEFMREGLDFRHFGFCLVSQSDKR